MPKILSAFGKLGLLALVVVLFVAGVLLSVYLSLRSPEVQVPDVVNQSRLDAETTLGKSGLDIRERASRFKPGVQPGIVLDQSPRPGEIIKVGQTVAVVVSRAPKEGERPPDEEVAEERREEEKTGTRNANANNANANRERRRSANRNANANNSNNANANTNGAANDNATRDGSDANARNANAPSNRNANANRDSSNTRNANQRNANARNSNSGTNRNANTRRPAGANANRQP